MYNNQENCNNCDICREYIRYDNMQTKYPDNNVCNWDIDYGNICICGAKILNKSCLCFKHFLNLMNLNGLQICDTDDINFQRKIRKEMKNIFRNHKCCFKIK